MLQYRTRSESSLRLVRWPRATRSGFENIRALYPSLGAGKKSRDKDEHIRIVSVARIDGQPLDYELGVSMYGNFDALVSVYLRKGKTMSYYAYLGPLGEAVRHGASFVASKGGFLIGTYNSFGEAFESLAWKGPIKSF